MVRIVFFILGVIMWQMQNKHKYKDTKSYDTFWKLVEYFTMLLGGYLIGGRVA